MAKFVVVAKVKVETIEIIEAKNADDAREQFKRNIRAIQAVGQLPLTIVAIEVGSVIEAK